MNKTKYNPYIHHRRSTRMKGYDYTQPGAYFVTICTWHRTHLFGEIVKSDHNMQEMILNQFGKIAKNEWLNAMEIRKNIILDEFIIMPNHMHGIIIIDGVGAHCNVPLQNDGTPSNVEKFGRSTVNSIPTIVKLFKATVTKQINISRQSPMTPVWQCNYYEHVIRDKFELNRIRDYIKTNPANWDSDENNV